MNGDIACWQELLFNHHYCNCPPQKEVEEEKKGKEEEEFQIL